MKLSTESTRSTTAVRLDIFISAPLVPQEPSRRLLVASVVVMVGSVVYYYAKQV